MKKKDYGPICITNVTVDVPIHKKIRKKYPRLVFLLSSYKKNINKIFKEFRILSKLIRNVPTKFGSFVVVKKSK